MSTFRALLVAFAIAALGQHAPAQPLIPQSQAVTTQIPGTPGDGVFIEVYNGIGGGPAPQPSDLNGRTPTGTTLSPRIDFPNPGQIIQVGQSFTLFFANTCSPPDVIRTAAARNFLLRHTFLVKITQDLDRVPATPEIDVQFGLGSDDGFHLTVGTTFLGSTGDRAFGYSWMPVRFGGPGLYPVSMLFSANAVGQSGLELSWLTTRNGGNAEIIPQSFMYLTTGACSRLIDFESLAVGTHVADQFRPIGAVFQTLSGDPQVTNVTPTKFVPVSGTRVFADPASNPTNTGRIEVAFVAPGTSAPALVDYVSLFVIDAETIGAVVDAYGILGDTLFHGEFHQGGATQQQVNIARTGIARVVVSLGQGADTSAIDNFCFSEPYRQPPDLAGTGDALPAAAFFGSQLLSAWHGQNRGGTPVAAPWSDRVYLSSDALWDGNDRTLTTPIPGPATLAESATYDRQAVCQLPLEHLLAPGSYHVLVRLDDAAAITESNETNNVIDLGAVQLDFPPLADLRVLSVSAPTVSFFATTFSVGGMIRNEGPGSAGSSWTDKIYLSTDTTLDTLDTQVGSWSSPAGLGGGESYSRSTPVSVPLNSGLPEGTYYLLVKADADNVQFESNDENNAAASPPVHLTYRTYPDLRVSDVALPPVAIIGSTAAIRFTVKNHGVHEAEGAWVDRAYLSENQQLDAADYPLVPASSHTGPLAPDGTYPVLINVVVPDRQGPHYIVVRTDDGNTVAENTGGEGNNTAASPATIDIQLPPKADLAVAAVLAPAVAQAGQSVIVDYSVVNNGNLAATGDWPDAIYVSRDLVLDSSDTQVRLSPANASPLAPGLSYARSRSVTLPDDFHVITDVHLLVKADNAGLVSEYDRANNIMASGAIRVNPTPAPNLTASIVSGPTAATFGQDVSVSWRVDNIGNRAANGSWRDQIVLSRDGTFSPDDLPIGSILVEGVSPFLPENPPYERSGAFRVPLTGLSVDGDYYLVLRTDINGAVGESIETDNDAAFGPFTVVRPPLPNLQATISMAPSTVAAGETAQVQWTIENIGPADLPAAPATPAWTLTIFEAANAVPGTARTPVANVGITLAIPSGGSISGMATVPIAELHNDSLVFVACADTSGRVIESVEGDNCGNASSPSFYNRPDLFVTAATVPGTAEAERTVPITWHVRNRGTTGAIPYWTDTVYLSATPSGSSLLLLGSQARASRVEVNGEYAVTLNVRIPDDLEGDYYFVVVTDPDNRVIETSAGENNNRWIAAAATRISQPARPNIVIGAIAIPASGLSGTAMQVAYTVSNIGPAPASASWFERIYASRDRTLSGDDLQLGSVLALRALDPADSYSQVAALRYPIPEGAWYLIVIADPTNVLREGLAGGENDNTRAADSPFNVTTFTAAAIADIDDAPAGTRVRVSGQAFIEGTLDVAPLVPVVIRVNVRGFERTLDATADSEGRFAAMFEPGPTEGGLYSTSAGPAHRTAPATDTFRLWSYRVYQAASANLFPEQVTTATLTLQNLGDVPITGVTITPGTLPSGVTLDINYPSGSTIPGLYTLPIEIRVHTDAATPFGSYPIPLAIASASPAVPPGALLSLVLGEPRAVLSVHQGAIDLGSSTLRSEMLLGTQTFVEFQVRNVGGSTTGPLTVLLPAAPWLSLASPITIPPLASGEEASVVLNLSPASTLMLGEYPGGLAINGADSGVTVNFLFKAVSDRRGDLSVIVTDEFTYYDQDNGYPKVRNATVKVFDHETHALVAQAQSDSNGHAPFDQLREAYYDIEISGADHTTARETRLVAGNTESSLVTFIARQVVRYQWTVVPTEIQDEYRFTIQAVFETHVPAPQIIIEPGYLDLRNQTLPTLIEYTIRNEGLIAAQNVTVPETVSGGYSLIPLVSNLGDLGGGQRVRVPVLVIPTGRGGNCTHIPVRVNWQLPCGPFLNGYSVSGYIYVGVCENKPGPPPSPGGEPGGGPGGGGGTFIFPPTILQPIKCKPCALKCGISAAECAGVPVKCAQAGWECGSVAHDFSLGRWGKCITGGIKCALTPIDEIVDNALFKVPCLCGLVRDCAVQCVEGTPCFACSLADLVDYVVGSSPCADRGPDTNDPEFNAFRQQFIRVVTVIGAQWYMFGTHAWLQVPTAERPTFRSWRIAAGNAMTADSLGSYSLTPEEQADLLQMPRPSNLSANDLNTFFDRYNRTLSYYALGIFNVVDVPVGWNTDFIERDVMASIYTRSLEALDGPRAEGFDGLAEAFSYALDVLLAKRAENAAGVCASVRIQIDQTLTLTRSAFNATLQIENAGGAGGQAIDNIRVRIIIKDENGADITSRFGVRAPSLVNLNAVDGSGTIPSGQTGSASWIIIPTDEAAPSGPTRAYVSGEFSYSLGGQTLVNPLFPVEITVLPNPNLQVEYFLEKEVFADDPFTAGIIEPSIPFSLGLLVKNTGAGPAKNVRIASSEPRIIENSRGLVVGFDIIGTQVGSQPISPSLNVNLGDLPPFIGTNVARWLMTSTLRGDFRSYSATYEHIDPLNDPRLSLVQSVDIFGLRHVVRADDTGDDTLPDFLTDDQPDLMNLPDRVHLSTGHTVPVAALTDSGAAVSTTALTANVHLTATPQGYFYLRLTDPFGGGFPLARVTRSDGKVIALDWNAWQTNRIKRTTGMPPQPQRYVHLFDFGGTGQYTIGFSPDNTNPRAISWKSFADHGDSLQGMGLELMGTTPTSEPRAAGIHHLVLQFNEAIRETTFTPANITVVGMNADGTQTNLSDIAINAEIAADGTFGLIRFTPPLPDRAMYCIGIVGARDLAGNFLERNARILVAGLKGDASGDARTNNSDVGGVLSLMGTNPLNPSNLYHLRSDLNNDGRIDTADRGIVLAARGVDLRNSTPPCPLGRDVGGIKPPTGITIQPGPVPPLPITTPPGGKQSPTDSELAAAPVDDSATPAVANPLAASKGDFAGSGAEAEPAAQIAFEITDPKADLAALLSAFGIDPDAVDALPVKNWYTVSVPEKLATVQAQASLATVLGPLGLFISSPRNLPDGSLVIATDALLVRFKEGVPAAWSAQVLSLHVPAGASITESYAATAGLYLIQGAGVRGHFSGSFDVAQVAKRLASRGDVAWAAPDAIVLRDRPSDNDRAASIIFEFLQSPSDSSEALIGNLRGIDAAEDFSPASASSLSAVATAEGGSDNLLRALLSAAQANHRTMLLANIWSAPDVRGRSAAQVSLTMNARTWAERQKASPVMLGDEIPIPGIEP